MYDANCARYESAYCNKCKDGYYLQNYICYPIDANCTQFDYRNMLCIVCANGMFASGNMCL